MATTSLLQTGLLRALPFAALLALGSAAALPAQATSLGAQETLLLAGRYPRLLAGAVAVDGPADFALQYRNFPRLKCDQACLARGWGQIGLAKQRLARKEVGGTPVTARAKFAERSPI